MSFFLALRRMWTTVFATSDLLNWLTFTLRERENHSIAFSRDISKPTRRACGEWGRAGLVGKILADIGSSSSSRKVNVLGVWFCWQISLMWYYLHLMCASTCAKAEVWPLLSQSLIHLHWGAPLKTNLLYFWRLFPHGTRRNLEWLSQDSEAIQVFGGPTQSPC